MKFLITEEQLGNIADGISKLLNSLFKDKFYIHKITAEPIGYYETDYEDDESIEIYVVFDMDKLRPLSDTTKHNIRINTQRKVRDYVEKFFPGIEFGVYTRPKSERDEMGGFYQRDDLTEIERDWRTREYEDEYPKLRDKMVPFIMKYIKSYYKGDGVINLYNGDDERIITFRDFGNGNGELYFENGFGDMLGNMLPHPLWYVHGKFLIQDVFKEYFPGKNIKRVTSANFI
jgi:hypothetical protein